LPDAIATFAPHADLIVNCTSLGMTPNVETIAWDGQTALRPGQIVYDLVYNPPVTRLLQVAARDGARALGGLGMLIWQGALAFEQWTGRPAPVDIMRGSAAAHFATVARTNSTPSAPVSVRAAQEADAGAISLLNAFLQRVHADAHPHFFKQPSPLTFPTDYVGELLRRPETVMLVAVWAGQVVGYLYGDTSPALETNATFPFARFYIHHLVVAPEAQGRGCGAALIQAAREYAHAHALGTLALSVWDFNRKARRFFERQGFTNYNHRMWIKGV
jgi:ribosomal protein S18 acetylase RimI-like enzyme